MRASDTSVAQLVQVTQALVAHELVHTYGSSAREAADLLGLVPSAVSQYLSGKRWGPLLSALAALPGARRVARHAAQDLLAADHPRELAPGLVLRAAHEIVGSGPIAAGASGGSIGAPPGPAADPRVAAFLGRRVALEQTAVADCMRLAQKSRDELTRAVFRQIASDSLRHAEIVASLASHLDRGLTSTVATGITRSDVDRLIRKEKVAEAETVPGLAERLGGVMGLLWESMEADERKHELLLHRLLSSSGPHRSARSSPRGRSRPAQGRIRSSSR